MFIVKYFENTEKYEEENWSRPQSHRTKKITVNVFVCNL